MLLDELKTGRIDHALAINLPAPRAGMFAWPAQRTDGTGPPTALPEGARLRLDPTVDVSSLHLPKLTRMIALAAQRYGLVVRDQTHHGISLFGEVPTHAPGPAYRRYFRGRTPGAAAGQLPLGPPPGAADAPVHRGALPPKVINPHRALDRCQCRQVQPPGRRRHGVDCVIRQNTRSDDASSLGTGRRAHHRVRVARPDGLGRRSSHARRRSLSLQRRGRNIGH